MNSDRFNDMQDKMERARRGIVSELIAGGMMDKLSALSCGIEFDSFTTRPGEDWFHYEAYVMLDNEYHCRITYSGENIEFYPFEEASA